jgi:hypothetical protein
LTGLAVWATPSAPAAEPVGLVLEVAGPADPVLDRLVELLDGGSYRLGPTTGLTFVHYQTCRVVTVVGGTLRLALSRYDVVGGRIESEQARQCPQRHVVAPTNASGGLATGALLLRSGTAAPATVPTRPELIFAGARADALAGVEIRRQNVVLARLPLAGRRLAWSRDREPLAAGDGYLLVLTPAGGRPVEIPFTVVDDSKSSESDRLLIIRID